MTSEEREMLLEMPAIHELIRERIETERGEILEGLWELKEKQIMVQNFDYACGFRDSIDFIRARNPDGIPRHPA